MFPSYIRGHLMFGRDKQVVTFNINTTTTFQIITSIRRSLYNQSTIEKN